MSVLLDAFRVLEDSSTILGRCPSYFITDWHLHPRSLSLCQHTGITLPRWRWDARKRCIAASELLRLGMPCVCTTGSLERLKGLYTERNETRARVRDALASVGTSKLCWAQLQRAWHIASLRSAPASTVSALAYVKYPQQFADDYKFREMSMM